MGNHSSITNHEPSGTPTPPPASASASASASAPALSTLFQAANASTKVQITALDSIINVNALFTVAVFIGLSLSTPRSTSDGNHCLSDAGDINHLLLYEFISFSCFLTSSIIAQGLKLAINLLSYITSDGANEAEINCALLICGTILSACASGAGFVCLLISMVSVIEVKLGKRTCGGDAMTAVRTLISLVCIGFFFVVLTLGFVIPFTKLLKFLTDLARRVETRR